MPSTENRRDSNIELYRILVMLLIMAHHYVVNSGLVGVAMQSPYRLRTLFVLLFGEWGKIGINCFILITGYFMCRSRATIKKYLKLLFEVEFYNIVIFFILLAAGYETLSAYSLLRATVFLSPESGRFASAFLMFYLFIPFLNILIRSLDQRKHALLILALLFVYTIRGSIPNMASAMNYVTWFIVIYVIGAYLRLYPETIQPIIKWSGPLLIFFLILSASSVLLGDWLTQATGTDYLYFFVSNSNKALAVITSVVAFLFFEKTPIHYHRWINLCGGSTFGVLLIHANSDAMRKWLWGDLLKNAQMYHSEYFYLHAFASVLVIFVLCVIIDQLRIKLIETPLFRILGSRFDRWDQALEEKFGL